jgi:hypothetical protein
MEIEKKTITYDEVLALNAVKNKGLSVDSFLALVKLKALVTRIQSEYFDTIKAIMEDAGVKEEVSGGYNFPKTDEGKALKTKIEDLAKKAIDQELKPIKFLTNKELHGATLDADINQIAAAAEWLLKAEE